LDPDAAYAANFRVGSFATGATWRQVRPCPLCRREQKSIQGVYVRNSSTPLIERNPLLFWKTTTVVLALAVIVQLAIQHGMHR